MRPDGRAPDQLRAIELQPNYLAYAEGSVLLKAGNTWVLCAASVEEKVPAFLEGKNKGWVTAEYGMLPRSTHTRSGRNPGGRGTEIQRLIGRALRAAIDTKKLGPRQITIDCDVLQADGGTRTASITGGYVALALAVARLRQKGLVKDDPMREPLAAISVGIVEGEVRLDLPYLEDSQADVDMNVVATESGNLIEIQGTAEGEPFPRADLDRMIDLAHKGIRELAVLQRAAIAQGLGQVIVFATRNRGKVRELAELCRRAGLGVRVADLDQARAELGLGEPPDVVEDRDTFAGNAAKKALEVARWAGRPALADDSGLEVDALGGAPGVWSARWAQMSAESSAEPGSHQADRDNNDKLVRALAGVPPERRSARFQSVVVLADPEGPLGEATLSAAGTCEGRVLEVPRGTGGFGYDPLFFCPEVGASFGEAPETAKLAVSHRARAMAGLVPKLRAYLAKRPGLPSGGGSVK